jgi:hemerythrin
MLGERSMEQEIFHPWQPNYSVGHPTLDEQHKKLLNLCAQALSCMSDESREGVAEFHDILNTLVSYIEVHFKTEEALLTACDYRLLDQHKEEHLAYQIKLMEFLFSATLGEINRTALYHYLSQWWSEHILGSDREYTESIRGLAKSLP